MAVDLIVTERFHQHNKFLEDNIDHDYGLLDKLHSKGTLTLREISEIKDCHPFYKRNIRLLQYIREQNKCNNLLDALREAKQAHLVNYVISNGEYKAEEFGDEWPLREKELLILKTNQEALIDLIEPGDLIGRLYSKGVINRRQRDAISSKLPCHEKNETLLEILRRRSIKDLKITIRCLRESNQDHLAELLEKGGVFAKVHAEGLGDKTEDEIIALIQGVIDNKTPEERRRILERTMALNVIGVRKGESVVLYVYCKTVIQIIQLKEMQIRGSLRTAVQRIFMKLLTFVQHVEVRIENPQIPVDTMHTLQLCSSQVNRMTVTLSEEEYERCRSYFPAGIKLRAMFNFDPEEMGEQQENELNNILRSKIIDLKDNGHTHLEFKMNANKAQKEDQAHSDESDCSEISLVEPEEHLNPFKMALSFKKGDLLKTVIAEDIGDKTTWWRATNLESGKIGYVPRRLVIIDYRMHLHYETSGTTSQTEHLKSDASNTSISNLPLDLLDSILQKSYLQLVLREKQFQKIKDFHAISQMASVDICWFQRIRRRKLKKEFWRSLIMFYRRREKISSIYRTSRQYLEENIRLNGLVNRLKWKDYLADVQTASLIRQKFTLGKKGSFKIFRDLISELAKKTEANHSIFRRSLLDTKQHLIAEIIENGGAMMKVEVRLQKAETSIKTLHHNLQIVERINEIRDKTKAKSHQIEELVGKLKQEGLEIQSARQDGEIIVVWIWCKTKNALEKLKTMNKSKHVIGVFRELLKILSFSKEYQHVITDVATEFPFLSKERNPAMSEPKVNIDFEEFEKTVVVLSIVANFSSRLNLRRRRRTGDEKEFVMGVTKMKSKIHVLLSRYSSVGPLCEILVFEDKIPFLLQKRIEIKEIEDPWDIASIEMENENSLYVLDRSKCVWKIKEEGDDDEKTRKIIRWLKFRDFYVYMPLTLSVTRVGQLLLVSLDVDDPVCSLRIYGGSEKAYLRLTIALPDDIQRPRHAVETSKGNFIISHEIKRKKEDESELDGGRKRTEEKMEEEIEEWISVISEVSGNGKTVLRRFIPKNKEKKFSHFVVDSLTRVFLTDPGNHRVILSDSDLQWNGILIPTEEDEKEGTRIWWPHRLFYDEETKQLMVGGTKVILVYILNKM